MRKKKRAAARETRLPYLDGGERKKIRVKRSIKWTDILRVDRVKRERGETTDRELEERYVDR